MKVSILTTTYNHERFIEQALESVLSQEVAFAYEHVIGEDCSTDRTRDLLLGAQRQHPDRIRLLLREQNIGRRNNFIDTFKACQGRYIAILEGDDYWTSTEKLQKQADYLDSHPECTICFHPVIKSHEDENWEKLFSPDPIKETYTLEDLLDRNFIATCSAMFRNHLFDEFPQWFLHVPAGDLPLHVLNAQRGYIGYIDEVMAVHRIHSGGVWSPKATSDRLEARIAILEALREHLGPAYEQQLDDSIAKAQAQIVWSLALGRNFQAIPSYIWSVLSQSQTPKASLAKAVIEDLGRRIRRQNW
jgi:glycosyltransferase involved in cell wall biosynthesis